MMSFAVRLFTLVVCAFPLMAKAQIVINEMMYDTPTHAPNQEWIELYNAGTNTVNLDGWTFTKGINFQFPEALLVPPGGFVVIAADPAWFIANYPAVLNVQGPWIGTLANGGEGVEIDDVNGNKVDEVDYAVEGDWARRIRVQSASHFGWDWFANHGGTGKSLERINPQVRKDSGQNWAASIVDGGTPSAANTVFSTNSVALILDTMHLPLVPRSTNSVIITSEIVDPRGSNTTVRLFYRVDVNPQVNPFTAAVMFDDGAHGDGVAGDGVYGAILPPRANTTIVEYYVEAVTSTGVTNSWPQLANTGGGVLAHAANALYQVDDSTYSGTQPIYRIIMTESERVLLNEIVTSDRNSDAAMNATFVTIDGAGTDLRYQSGVRIRGAGTRGRVPPNLRVDIPADKRWKGVSKINLNTQFTHAQVAGAAVATRSGLNTEITRAVQVRVNGANLASSGSPQFGSYAAVEVPDRDYVDNHFPLDNGGNLYRASSGGHSATLAYLGTNINSYISSGYAKANNSSENDWTDLINLTFALSPATPDATYVNAVRQNVNVDAWMLYFAVFALLESEETSLGTGFGDDYSMYRGADDPRFLLLAHDWDTVLNQGDTAGLTTRNIFRATSLAAIARFMRHSEFVPTYYATLKRLLETSFSNEQESQTLDEVLGSWVPAGTIFGMKQFATNRNAYVLSQIPQQLTASSPLPVVSGFPQSGSATAQIFGFSDVINTRTVLVNNATSAWSAWEGRWTNSSVALRPGINRVLVQALGTNGTEITRTNIDIWYTAPGTTVSGTITTNTTWNAASGPYNVTGNITVPAGVTLTISNGTTVFMGAGTTFTVNGRLLAPGTDLAHIRFTRVPGGGNWGSLDFINTTNESRLEYVDIDSCAGTSIGGHAAEIHVNGGSIVFFDHLVFANTPAQQYISFDGSTFIVQNSFFPTYPVAVSAPEMIHGVNGIPASGYGIFRGNYVGHTYGYNDSFDFTGGQRPNAILQIINNVFDGASDDHLDLDSTDAWIEGNIFIHAHRDPNSTAPPLDTASAISGGVDNANQFSEWTIINNLFYDVDHVLLNKGGGSPGAGRFIFVNNTVAHVAKENGAGLTNDIGAFVFTDDNVPLAAPGYGAGAYVAGNIIWDTPRLAVNYNPSNHTVIFDNNILAMPWTGPGSNNIVADPRLNLGLITSVTNADWKTVKAALTLRSGSPAFGAGLAGFDAGAGNPPGLLMSGAPSGVTTSRSATVTVLPGGVFYWGNLVPPYLWGYTHYRWRFDNGPWSTEIAITNFATITVSNLNNGPHSLSVAGKNDAGYYQDDPFVYPTNSAIPAHTTTRFWFVNTNLAGRVIFNEVLARNVHAFDHENTTPDAIELFNPGTTTVNLSGKGLTDDPSTFTNRYKFVFPTNATIAPGQYLIVFADNAATSGLHLGFGLNQNGDTIYLYDSVGNGGALLDFIKFGLQLEDLSIGRLPDNSWALNYPTIGAPNLAYPVGDVSLLKINEWLADATVGDDFVEVFNRDTLPVNIGNAWFSDAPVGSPLLHQVPPLSFLPASGYVPFRADGNIDQGADHLSFKLSADGGSISLSAPDGSLIDFIQYGPQSTDISEGRSPNGELSRNFFVVPTPGAPNPFVTTNVVITETTTVLVPYTNPFRYDVSRVDQGTFWRGTNFDDTIWSSGLGALYFIDGAGTLPVPINTILPTSVPLPTTAYFRTHFNWAGDPTGTNLYLSHVIDDGAVFYLNGQEVLRYNMPGAPTVISYSTPASVNVGGNAAIQGPVAISAASLVLGDNVLAIEVHQQNASSSDVAMGVTLENTIRTTNLVAGRLVLNEVMANNHSYTNVDGIISDWLELFNPGGTVLDLSDMSLSDDVATPRRWVFPSGTTIGAGAYLIVKFDSSLPASTNTAGNLNTGFGFSSGGDSALIFDKLIRGGALVDGIQFGLQAADFTIGRVPNGGGAWTLTLPTEGSANIPAALGNAGTLRINEWMANPRPGNDDYFELYNPNPQPVSIGGLFLTDDLNNRMKYRIPNLSFIGVGVRGFVEFRADSNPQNGADHTNFGLSGSGESIGLFGFDGLTQIDAITFGNQQSGVSEGRFPDGATNIVRFAQTPTPGQANFLPFNDVVINEALTHSTLPLEDAIELFNPTASPIDVSGWYLSDSQLEPRKFRIPAGTIIQPGGFVVFYENQFNPTFVFPSFSLSSADGDQIFLSLTDTNGNLTGYRSSVEFGAQVDGVTFGRFETSIGSDFVAMTARTLGADAPATVEAFRLGQGKTNASPKVGPIVINEINYHPPEMGTNDNVRDEFIELYNSSVGAVQLFDPVHPTNTWHLRGAVDFNFPTNTSVPAGGYLVVVGFDPATNAAALAGFRTFYGISPAVTILGPWDGKLSNDDDDVRLNRPDEPILGDAPYVLVEHVDYRDSLPWPSAADGNTNGTGISLQRVVAANFANDPVNWIAGSPTPGAANGPAATPAPSITLQPTNRTVTAGTIVNFVASAAGSPPLQYQWRFNGIDIPGATNASYAVFSAQFTNAGSYSLRVANVAGVALSASAVLAIQSGPQILFQPQDRNVAVGGNATFSVGARGTAPIDYRWWKDGAPLAGATQGTLVITNVQAPNLGNYFVVISNAYGSATSSVASLQISTPPQIATQPTNQTVIVGQTVTLFAGVTGTTPLFFQWNYNGFPLAGANNSTLVFSNVQPSRSGTYSLFVSNLVGTALSTNITLIVVVPPTVTIAATDPTAAEAGLNPGAFTITRGSGSTNVALTVNFNIGGTAQNGTDYQSIPASVTIPSGANSVPITITPLDDPNIEANETVTLSLLPSLDYLVGSPSNATVTIFDNDNFAPSVTILTPTNNTFVPITPTNIFISANASDANPGQSVRVDFYFGPTSIGQALVPPYEITWTNPPSGSNLLTAVATDVLGLSTTSAPVALSINGPPAVSITSPPNGAAVPGGGNVLITASATDTNGGVAQVDFYLGGVLFSTATNAPYSATVVNPAQAPYQTFAVARDPFGLSATSAVVNFTVVPPSTNFADMFAARGFIGGYTNFKTANNIGASKESGEPNHYAPNAGGRSVWLSWVSPGSGVVTIDLANSTFDTVMAVYTNAPGVAPAVTNLIKVAENDDNGASIQSRVVFTNTVPGAVFHIAIDGYNAASGSITMRVSLPNSPPSITTQPVSQTNNVGANVVFTVGASSPTALSYQWRFNGANITGANNASLSLTNIQLSNVGNYDVRVSNASGSVTSLVATLTIGGGLPQLVNFARITNNVFTMTFTGGVTNRGYIIESSSTLTNWNFYTSITTTGAVTIVDTNPPPAPGTIRAFRARLGP